MSSKKQNLLNAATILFAQKGFTETSVAELARLTGTAEGTLFYHFKTKADLFTATLAGVREGIINEFESYMTGRDFASGMEMMEQVIAFYLYLAGHREEWLMLLQRHYTYDFARTNQECRQHLEAIFTTLIDLFEGAVIKGQADGSMGAMPTRKTALLVFSMVNGLVWLNLHGLYDAGVLYQELLAGCRRMLAP